MSKKGPRFSRSFKGKRKIEPLSHLPHFFRFYRNFDRIENTVKAKLHLHFSRRSRNHASLSFPLFSGKAVDRGTVRLGNPDQHRCQCQTHQGKEKFFPIAGKTHRRRKHNKRKENQKPKEQCGRRQCGKKQKEKKRDSRTVGIAAVKQRFKARGRIHFFLLSCKIPSPKKAMGFYQS